MPDSPARGRFDAQAFFSALDSERQSRRLNWKTVAEEAGVSQSTLTRLGQNKRPDVDSLAALASWANLRVDDFVRHPDGELHDQGHPTPLTMISTHLRADRNLSDEAATALEEVIKATYERLRRE